MKFHYTHIWCQMNVTYADIQTLAIKRKAIKVVVNLWNEALPNFGLFSLEEVFGGYFDIRLHTYIISFLCCQYGNLYLLTEEVARGQRKCMLSINSFNAHAMIYLLIFDTYNILALWIFMLNVWNIQKYRMKHIRK